MVAVSVAVAAVHLLLLQVAVAPTMTTTPPAPEPMRAALPGAPPGAGPDWREHAAMLPGRDRAFKAPMRRHSRRSLGWLSRMPQRWRVGTYQQ